MNIKTKVLSILIILTIFIVSGCSKDDFNYTKITSNNNQLNIKSDKDIEVTDEKISIISGGEYTFSGEGIDVQIVIDSTEDVIIILDNVSIENNDVTPIKIVSDGNILIETVGKVPSKISVTNDKKNYCINSKGSLSFAGDSTLYLEGNVCIKTDGELNMGGIMEIVAHGDAIRADYINLSCDDLTIYADKDGIQADEINVLSGNCTIIGTSDKSRGIYSKGNLIINKSCISINTVDDGIYSKDKILINEGTITIKSKDDAIHGDKEVEINGGSIIVSECLEGIESSKIIINDGSVDIKSSNDGINSAHSDKKNSNTADIYINNGDIKINAEGDGLDANGSIYINGGILFVSGAYSGDNSAIDFDDEFIINGGTIIAAGSNLKAKAPSLNSMQNSIMIIYESNQSAGNNFIVTDEFNNALFVADFPKAYDCVIFSSDKLINNYKYFYGITILDIFENAYLLDSKSEDYTIENFGQFIITSNITLIREETE